MDDKRILVERMLAKGDTMLCVDSRHPGVRVPDPHLGRPDLRLILNLNFRRPIDLRPEGIRAELSFGGIYHVCWVPYESLWAVYNPNTGEGYLWSDRVPDEVRKTLNLPGPESGSAGSSASDPDGRERAPGSERQGGIAGMSPGTGSARRGSRPALRVIPGGRKDPED